MQPVQGSPDGLFKAYTRSVVILVTERGCPERLTSQKPE
jgi:hypothetical protein